MEELFRNYFEEEKCISDHKACRLPRQIQFSRLVTSLVQFIIVHDSTVQYSIVYSRVDLQSSLVDEHESQDLLKNIPILQS